MIINYKEHRFDLRKVIYIGPIIWSDSADEMRPNYGFEIILEGGKGFRIDLNPDHNNKEKHRCLVKGWHFLQEKTVVDAVEALLSFDLVGEF